MSARLRRGWGFRIRLLIARGWPPHEFPGGDNDGAIFDEQLAAFEEGVEQWWRVVPAPEGADPGVWHFLEED